MTPLKIIVADDHPLFRLGIKTLLTQLDFVDEVKEAENGVQVIELLKGNFFDIVFMDVIMPVTNGIDVTKKIKKEFSRTRVIALTMYEDQRHILEMFEAGASGYLLKNTNTEEIKNSIFKVMNNQVCFSNQLSENYLKLLIGKLKLNVFANGELSKREKEILLLICNQHSTKEIAEKLFLSEKTISWHRENIMLKTGSKNMAGLVMYAYRHRLINENGEASSN